MSKGVLEPSYRKRTGYQAALLGGMAMFASATLVLGDMRTRGPIAEREAEDLQRSLAQVIPVEYHDNDLIADTIRVAPLEGEERVLVYRATRDGAFKAAAFEIAGTGYAGEMRFIMGVDSGGRILGVRVLSHAETPGLGDKIEVEKDDWMLGFDGRSLSNTESDAWAVRKDGGEFDQFTGATITPRGVVNAVHEGLQLFRARRDAIAVGDEKPVEKSDG